MEAETRRGVAIGTSGWQAIRESLLETVFPGRCLLCGQWLFPSSGIGGQVCPPCRSSLTGITGERCGRCGAPLSSEQGVCTRCREMDYAFDSNFSLFEYAGPARQLIAEFKFAGRRRLAWLFASLLGEQLRALNPGVPVVPVPPRPGRRRSDGVGMIAERLRAEGFQVLQLLERTGGAPQKSLDFEHRRKNLRGRIRVAGSAGSVSLPLEVILLDDVFTTGATADTCARVLREAGCRKVSVVTLALD